MSVFSTIFIVFSITITRELGVYTDNWTYFHEDGRIEQRSSGNTKLGEPVKNDSGLGTRRIRHTRSTITKGTLKEQKSCDIKIKTEKCLWLLKIVINQNIGGKTISYLSICRHIVFTVSEQ